ncbi:MAG: YfiR family protein, partial [Caulobacteraceae bacterium]
VEAAYLAKFAPFVAWPAAAFPTARSPLVLCVQGQDPFGAMLDRLTAGQAVRGHPVIVRKLARLTADSGCHIAYVGGSSAQPRAAALRAVDGRPVLTVTDADDEGERAIVRLVRIDGRVRFMIDARKAGQSGLTISSKLLALAAGVRR